MYFSQLKRIGDSDEGLTLETHIKKNEVGHLNSTPLDTIVINGVNTTANDSIAADDDIAAIDDTENIAIKEKADAASVDKENKSCSGNQRGNCGSNSPMVTFIGEIKEVGSPDH